MFTMTIQWYDFVGTTGVVLILWAYFLLQTERVSSADLSYSTLNLIGAALITVSLFYDFNLSAFIIELFWIAFSIYGIMRSLSAKRRAAIQD